MGKSKNNKKSKKQHTNYLPFLTIAVVLIAVAIVVLVPKGNSQNNTSIGNPVTLNENGDVVIKEADTDNGVFLEYESKDGLTVGLLAVRASDGTVRTAFDTCQVCNGSPYAFFEQKGDQIQCQNCGNVYSLDMVEQERGGCNPIPIMADEKTVTDTEIIIPSALLEENAAIFENWKKF